MMSPIKPSTRYARWITSHRWAVLLSTLVLVAICGAGLSKLSFTNDYRVYFDPDNAQLQAYEKLENTFTKGDNILFVLTANDGSIFGPDKLAAIESLTAQAWKLSHSIRVDSITNFQHSYAEQDDLVVADLVENARDLTPARINAIREIALSEQRLVNSLISPSGHTTGVNVTIKLPKGVLERQVVTEARAMAQQFAQTYPAFTVHVTGMVMMNNVFPEAAERDIMTLIPLMFLAVALGLRLFFGAIAPTLATLSVVGLTNIVALGIAGWMGMALSPVSVSAPTIILTIAVADCVHIIVGCMIARREHEDAVSTVVASLTANIKPILITSLTTAVGFLGMNASDAPPFRDLGNIVAIGVTAALVLSLVFLPALMSLLSPVRPAAATRTAGLMQIIANAVINKPKTVLLALMIPVAALTILSVQNEVNDNFVEYFDESLEFRRSADYASEHLTGLNLIEYAIDSGKPEGISEPAYLATLEAFSEWYRAQPKVIYVGNFTTVMKRLNTNIHNDDPAHFRIPQDPQLAAQILLLYELSLPFGLDLNNQLSMDKSTSRFTVLLDSITTNELLALEQRAQAWLRTNAPAPMHTVGASPTVMFAHVGVENIKSMFKGAGIALVCITIILLLVLRSLRLGAISVLANVLPAATAFGLWALLVGRIGVASAAVLSVTLGIVVDDTVHFLSKYHTARHRGLNVVDAVRDVLSTVGPALVVTSMVLIAGFAVLSLSAFVPNGELGLLTAITIALALVLDILLLPALLILGDRWHQRRKAPTAQRDIAQPTPATPTQPPELPQNIAPVTP